MSASLHSRPPRSSLPTSGSRRLSLEVPVCFPLSTSIPTDWHQEQYPSSTGTQSLKFKSSEGNPLSVEARVRPHSDVLLYDEADATHHLSQLAFRPLPHRSHPLTFTVVLTPSSPSAIPLLTADNGSPNFKLTTTLSRKVVTSPVKDPSMGQAGFRWAGVRIAGGEASEPIKLDGGRWVLHGEIKVPPNECTVDSLGVGVTVSAV